MFGELFGEMGLKFFCIFKKENMNSLSFWYKILTKMNELILDGWKLKWDSDNKHKSKEALKFYSKRYK